MDWVDPTYNYGPFVLAHGDLHPSNIIIREDLTIVAIIDWEWSRIVPAQLLVPPTWLTGRELSGIYRYFEQREYISELIKLREAVRAREGSFPPSDGPALRDMERD
jgi:RIO-like serine/threonine protein kinase